MALLFFTSDWFGLFWLPFSRFPFQSFSSASRTKRIFSSIGARRFLTFLLGFASNLKTYYFLFLLITLFSCKENISDSKYRNEYYVLYQENGKTGKWQLIDYQAIRL
jgi:hypothetical protein